MNISINKIRGLILVTAVILLTVGLKRGEYMDVLDRAVMICMECIGIG